jgi:O-antigen/teichoic acid export membrane protein
VAKNKEHSIVKKTAIYAIGTFSSNLLKVLIVPIYANYILPKDLGRFDYQNTIASFLAPIMFLAIWEGILRFGLNESNQQKLTALISTTIFFGVGATIFWSVLLPLPYLKIFNNLPYGQLFILSLLLQPILSTLQIAVRGIKESKNYVISSIIASFVNVGLLVILVVLLKLGLLGLLLSFLIGNLVNILYLVFGSSLLKYISVRAIDKKILKKLLKFSWPLIFNLVFAWFLGGYVMFYLGSFVGSSETGFFAFANKFAGIVAMFGYVLAMATIEDTIITSENDNFIESFTKKNTEMFKMFLNVGILLLPAIGIYYSTLGKSAYLNTLIIVPLLLMATVFQVMSTNVGNIVIVHQKTKYIAIASLLVGIFNAIFCFVGHHYLGLIGICISYLFASFLLFMFRYKMGQKIQSYKLQWKSIVMLGIAFSSLGVIIQAKNLLIDIILMVVIIVFEICIYRNVIVAILKRSAGRI